jgi:hypothetical protein
VLVPPRLPTPSIGGRRLSIPITPALSCVRRQALEGSGGRGRVIVCSVLRAVERERQQSGSEIVVSRLTKFELPRGRRHVSECVNPRVVAATHFWALANSVFSKGPKSGPKKRWLYANHLGRPRTMERRFSPSFPGGYLRFLRYRGRQRTSREVYGVGTADHRDMHLSA